MTQFSMSVTSITADCTILSMVDAHSINEGSHFVCEECACSVGKLYSIFSTHSQHIARLWSYWAQSKFSKLPLFCAKKLYCGIHKPSNKPRSSKQVTLWGGCTLDHSSRNDLLHRSVASIKSSWPNVGWISFVSLLLHPGIACLASMHS